MEEAMTPSDITGPVTGSFGQMHPIAGSRCGELPVQLMFPMAAAQAYATSASLQYAMPMPLLPGQQFPSHQPFGMASPQHPLFTIPAGQQFLPSDRMMPMPQMLLNTFPTDGSTNEIAQPLAGDGTVSNRQRGSFDRQSAAPPVPVRSSRVSQQDVPVAHSQLAAQISGPTATKSRGPPAVTWLSLRGGHSTHKPEAGHLV